jgi:hypothetical protein
MPYKKLPTKFSPKKASYTQKIKIKKINKLAVKTQAKFTIYGLTNTDS